MATPQSSWTGQSRIKGQNESLRMILLTFSIIGLQFAWGTEMTYCTPYLLSLGLSKSRLSLVWVAGPLSGLVMQPIIGMMSDKSTSRYGRRRPFMLAGSAAVVVCYLVLGWAKEIAGWFVADTEAQRRYAVFLAIGDIYVLDFVINIAQSTCRALIVDTLPISKQQLGAAWASRMVGIGHLLVYAVGALDLNRSMGNFLGDTQFKKVCAIAAVAMGVAQGVTCWAVEERVLVSNGDESNDQGILSVLSQIYKTVLNVPEPIQAICWVQFWSWIGWFTFLCYGSTWVGEIYLRHEAPTAVNDATNALDIVGKQGSRALIVYSIVATVSSVVLPWLIWNPDDEQEPAYTARPPKFLTPILQQVTFQKPSILTAWALGCLLFAASMVFAPLASSVATATTLTAICGVSNAIAGLAPSALLGVEVNRMSSSIPSSRSPRSRRSSAHSSPMSIQLSSAASSPKTLHLRHDSPAPKAPSSTGELSGIYLGILNIYTTLPQFVGTAISWVVFSLLEPGLSPELAKDADPNDHHSSEGLSGIGVSLFIGALSAMRAAWATKRLKESY